MVYHEEIPALRHYVLEESFVTEVVESEGRVDITLDLVLAKDHPEVLPARPGEWAYFRTGIMRFDGVTEFVWTNKTVPATDADGTRSWNGIDSFTLNGRVFELDGDLGQLRIVADTVSVVLTGPA